MTNEAGLEFDRSVNKNKMPELKIDELLKISKTLLNAKVLANDKGFPRLSIQCEEAWDIVMRLIGELKNDT